MGGRKDVVLGDCKYGTSFDAKQWVSLDPCGLAGCSCSFSIHIFALVTIYGYLIYNSYTAQIIFYFIYIPASLLALTSLFKAWTTDPGAVPMGARPLVTVKRAGSSNTAEAEPSNNNNNNNNNETSSDNPQPKDGNNTKGGGGSRRMKRRERGLRRCHKCNDNYKPNRAHHDSVTGRCIVKMDHFCPWVGNAIGALNHKFFVLFIFYTMCTTLLSLLLLLLRAIHCGFYAISDDNSNSTDKDITTAPQMMTTTATSSGEYVRETANQVIHQQEEDIEMDNVDPMLLQKVLLGNGGGDGGGAFEVQYCNDLYTSKCVLLLLVISFIFLIFTSCMLVEQIEAITTNTGKIARMKMRVGNAGLSEFAPVTQEFNEMFGGNTPHITWHWFLPITVTFHPRSMKKVILGYDYDESCDNPTTPYEEPNVTHNSNNINNCCVTTDHNATNNNNGNNDGNNNKGNAAAAGGSSNDDSDTRRTSSLTLDDNDNNSLSVPAAADQDSSSGMEEIVLTSSSSVWSDNGSGSDVESGLQSRQKVKKRANSRGALEIV